MTLKEDLDSLLISINGETYVLVPVRKYFKLLKEKEGE